MINLKKTHIKRILIRAPNWIGDAVLSLPALDALKTIYPQAEITILAKSWVSPVYDNNQSVKNIIVYDRPKSSNSFLGNIPILSSIVEFRLVRELNKGNFDIAVLFQNAFKAALIVFLAGIKIRTGYSRDLRGLLLSHPIRFDSAIRNTHQVFYYLNIVNNLSKEIQPSAFGVQPKIFIKANELEWANVFLNKKNILNKTIIGMAPGASYGPAKRWLAEGFKETANKLLNDFGATLIVFGGKDDYAICSEVLSGLEGFNTAGKLELRNSIALISRCSLFITNDSGLMHIAASLGVPTLAIFGSTDPKLTGPVGNIVKVIKKDIECSPCFDRTCRYGHYNCMKMITVNDVYSCASDLLS